MEISRVGSHVRLTNSCMEKGTFHHSGTRPLVDYTCVLACGVTVWNGPQITMRLLACKKYCVKKVTHLTCAAVGRPSVLHRDVSVRWDRCCLATFSATWMMCNVGLVSRVVLLIVDALIFSLLCSSHSVLVLSWYHYYSVRGQRCRRTLQFTVSDPNVVI